MGDILSYFSKLTSPRKHANFDMTACAWSMVLLRVMTNTLTFATYGGKVI